MIKEKNVKKNKVKSCTHRSHPGYDDGVEDCNYFEVRITKTPLNLAMDISEDFIQSKSCTQYDTGFEDCNYFGYRLIASIPLNHCHELAPNISGECRSSYLVWRGDYTGGALGEWITYNIYGLFELKDKRKVVVSLKNFDNKNNAKSYVESIIER